MWCAVFHWRFSIGRERDWAQRLFHFDRRRLHNHKILGIRRRWEQLILGGVKCSRLRIGMTEKLIVLDAMCVIEFILNTYCLCYCCCCCCCCYSYCMWSGRCCFLNDTLLLRFCRNFHFSWERKKLNTISFCQIDFNKLMPWHMDGAPNLTLQFPHTHTNTHTIHTVYYTVYTVNCQNNKLINTKMCV